MIRIAEYTVQKILLWVLVVGYCDISDIYLFI